MTASHPLSNLLHTRIPAVSWDWWESTAELEGQDQGGFRTAFSAAAHHVGRTPLHLARGEQASLRAWRPDLELAHWGEDDLARGALLLRAATILTPSHYDKLVQTCYRAGDQRDRQCILRLLPMLPHGERFLALAQDGAHSEDRPLFEAIACDNIYPAARFPALAFKALQCRAVLLGLPRARVLGVAPPRARAEPDA